MWGDLFLVCEIKEKQLAVILIPLQSYSMLSPEFLLKLIGSLSVRSYQSILIPEDLWLLNKEQIWNRLTVRLGFFERIHARKCKVVSVTQPDFFSFMDKNHLIGGVKSKYKYGLEYEGKVVAMASFSALRKYYRGERIFNSSELVRFANFENRIVAGGLSKLITHFEREKHPDDIMTYVDRHWSNGQNYNELGFALIGCTMPKIFWFNPKSFHRLSENSNLLEINKNSSPIDTAKYMESKGYMKTFDLGNYKFLKLVSAVSS